MALCPHVTGLVAVFCIGLCSLPGHFGGVFEPPQTCLRAVTCFSCLQRGSCLGVPGFVAVFCLGFHLLFLLLGHLFNLNGIAVYRLNEVYLDS